MYDTFVRLLNMSLAASVVVFVIVILRLLLKQAPRKLICLLWALAALRLLLPFSIQSDLSAFNLMESSVGDRGQIEYFRYNGKTEKPTAEFSVPGLVNDNMSPDSMTVGVRTSGFYLPTVVFVWLAGVCAMLVYAAVSYFYLRKKTAASIRRDDGLRLSDDISSPFILGILRPVIYIPSGMDENTLSYVAAHEKAHIRRRDHWWKPFGFLLLCVYWFNPVIWLAYILLCRDIELACDERVIKDLDRDSRAAYSEALLALSRPRRMVAACPLAFGEVGVKERIKSVLDYKKPAFWIVLAACLVCILLAVCFLTDSSGKKLDARLGVSMDMAIVEHNQSAHSDGHFAATDYDVLRVAQNEGTATVYAWVLYEEYSFDGGEIHLEQGSSIPCAITFDTEAEGDVSSYDVIEYWQPRDGSLYAKDIREKFPMALWKRAFDGSGAKEREENCRKAAEEYYSEMSADIVDVRPMLKMNGVFYIDPYMPVSSLPNGYVLAGVLTAEQAHNTGLTGTQYYKDPDEPEDLYTYQLCGTPTGLGEVDNARRTWQYLRWIRADADVAASRTLTLDDVRRLAAKGEELTWGDFERYRGTDIGSGLTIMQYGIDDLFEVRLIGPNREANEKPISILLVNHDINAWVDIRTDDVEGFIQSYTNFALPFDVSSLDIDDDGILESCSILPGPTSGLYTQTITASADGNIKYRNTFCFTSAGIVGFEERDAVPGVLIDYGSGGTRFHRLFVENDRIVIDGLGPEYVSYWGGADWNFDMQ